METTPKGEMIEVSFSDRKPKNHRLRGLDRPYATISPIKKETESTVPIHNTQDSSGQNLSLENDIPHDTPYTSPLRRKLGAIASSLSNRGGKRKKLINTARPAFEVLDRKVEEVLDEDSMLRQKIQRAKRRSKD